MPKKAPSGDTIDPVRSRLAASVAAQITAPVALAETGFPVRTSPPAVGDVPPAQPARSIEAKPRVSKPVRTDPQAMRVAKKFLVTEGESNRIEISLDVIEQAFGSKVSYSQASRALWTVLSFAEDAMVANPRRGEPLRRPSKGDSIGMAEYEEAIADYLRVALKRT